jgi:CMP-N-acetylneuraminic acid synthetase
MRPAELGGHATPMVDVLRHMASWLWTNENYLADIIVLLQPTSPLRRAEHIDAAVDILVQSGADTVVSVVAVPHQFNPVSLMRAEEGRLVPFLEGRMILRRQDKPQVYARNGPAVIATRRGVVEKGHLYGMDCRPLVMSREESLDIDEPFDLMVADWILRSRECHNEYP